MKYKYKLKYCELLINRGFTYDEIVSRLKTQSSRNKNYWLERGYDDVQSVQLSKSRQPGTLEYYTIFKNKPLDEAKYLVEKYQSDKAITKLNFVKKYGDVIGIKKWESYCEKHRIKNTFEYKQKKLGWDINTFNRYNKSRSVTLNNLIKRHGDSVGRDKWKLYIERQSYTKSEKYVVEKYGADVWKQLCKRKRHTYESYLERYNGNIELAVEKYNEYLKSTSPKIGRSKIADDFCANLVNRLISTNYKQYYCGIHNQEWFLNVKGFGVIFLDFFLRDTGKVIEFYGDYWHANPIKYKVGNTVNLRDGNIKKVEDVWLSDKIRIDHILNVPYIEDVKIVWESDYRTDPTKILNESFDFLIK